MPLARTLMVQGTASSVGKSLLVTALCRHFANQGLSVAPFKGLNMALNAYVTRDGKEMARAQSVQAQACGIEPTVLMNPVLLKPEGALRSQLVVLGKVHSTRSAHELFSEGVDLKDTVLDALATLRAAHDLVIIEGAGSPAEVNLRARDLANMFVALAVRAPVLLAGDIDRGGVIAAFVGTMALLSSEERALVRGFIVNKFRGDVRLFDSALTFIREQTGVSVLGVVPHLGRHGLPEEDSLDVDARVHAPGERAAIEVYVLRLPHLSNHDEFQPLEHEPGVSLVFGDDVERALQADLLVIPGSKSTLSDLAFVRTRGLDHVIFLRAQLGRPVLGICGGCQMLGHAIVDEQAVESPDRHGQGLALLPIDTHFRAEKRTRRVRVRPASSSFLSEGVPGQTELMGYYIHAGRIQPHADRGEVSKSAPLFSVRDGDELSSDGAASPHGHVLGTMVHGLFENDVLRHSVLDTLRAHKGLGAGERYRHETRGAAFDELARALAAACDMAQIERLALG